MSNQSGRRAALLSVAVATREKVDEVLLKTYLEDERIMAHTDEDFADACRQLKTADWFPKLGELVKACQTVRFERYKASERERLAKMEERNRLMGGSEPFTKEESAAILAKLYDACHGIKR